MIPPAITALSDLGVQKPLQFASMNDVAQRIRNVKQLGMRTLIFGSFYTVAAFKRSWFNDGDFVHEVSL